MAVTDVFLDRLLHHIKGRGIPVVSLDECVARLDSNDRSPFVCLTFDDGYRDNYDVAYPVLRSHAAPAAIFLATGLLDRTSPMWWHPLERALAVGENFGLGASRHAIRSETDRRHVYAEWADRFRRLDPAGKVRLVEDLAEANPHFRRSDAFESALSWDMVDEMARSGLITFGAHTVSHPVMAHLSESDLIEEVGVSRDRCAARVGREPRYFAYPFGQPHETGPLAPRVVAQAGFSAAFTTQATTLRSGADRFRLPRIMLTQQTQNTAAIDAYLSGLTELIKTLGVRSHG